LFPCLGGWVISCLCVLLASVRGILRTGWRGLLLVVLFGWVHRHAVLRLLLLLLRWLSESLWRLRHLLLAKELLWILGRSLLAIKLLMSLKAQRIHSIELRRGLVRNRCVAMWLRLLESGHRLLLLLLLLLKLLLLLLLPLGLLIVGEALRVRLGDLLFWVHGAFVLAFVLMLAVTMGRGRR
jgi:hypothetical protein